LAKKREVSLNSYSVQGIQDTNFSKHSEYIDNIYEHFASPTFGEQGEYQIVKQWLTERIKEKLQRESRVSLHTHKPILLYRKSIEESENAIEEEVCHISGNYIVRIMYAFGGFIPSKFETIEVFTVDKFTKWIVHERNRDLLLQCIEELEK
jgi:hypothetical protein